MEPSNFEQLLAFIKGFNQIVVDEVKAAKAEITVKDPYESEDTREIATALAKAQGEYPRINCNRENPYFKSNFADLDSIMGYIRPILARQGLSFTQQTIISPEGATILHSKIRHLSGQWIDSRTRIIPPKNDQQSYSSTLTYMRRHSALALLNITVSSDMGDDDAEVAMEDARVLVHKGTNPNAYNPRNQSVETINSAELEEFNRALKKYPDLLTLVLNGLSITHLKDMPRSKYEVSITRVRELSELRDQGIK